MGVEVCMENLTCHSLELGSDHYAEKVNLFQCFLNCTYVSVPAPLLSYVPAFFWFFAFGKRAGISLTRMSTLSSDMLVYCGSKCAYSSLRMCRSLCVCVYISNPLTCLSVFFCVLGCVCVSDTALPLMSWVWGQDGSSGRRRVLVWERVNAQRWNKLPWLRHFLPSQLILKRNILNVCILRLNKGCTQRSDEISNAARMCDESTNIVSLKNLVTENWCNARLK